MGPGSQALDGNSRGSAGRECSRLESGPNPTMPEPMGSIRTATFTNSKHHKENEQTSDREKILVRERVRESVCVCVQLDQQMPSKNGQWSGTHMAPEAASTARAGVSPRHLLGRPSLASAGSRRQGLGTPWPGRKHSAFSIAHIYIFLMT